MRCSNCGFPLSPSRTTCSRCGTNYKGLPRKAWSEQDALHPQADPFPAGNMPASPHVQPGYVEADAQYAQRNAYPTSAFYEAPTTVSEQGPLQTGMEFSLTPTVKKQSMPHPIAQKPEPNWSPTTSPQAMTHSSSWTNPPSGLFPQATYNPASPPSLRRTRRIGFTVAGICLTAGALILAFVSILAQPFLSANTLSSQATPVSPRNAPLATTPAIATPTPTQVFPGAHYITNARMASAVNEATGQATEYATDFSTNQRIYVTFALHAGQQGGAVCLHWYMNDQFISHYEFSVGKNQLYNSYSYSSMSSPGAGYTEIYWATTASCTDKLLAARVPFTVS